MTAVLETSGLTKRYRRVTALSDCTISVPEGRISALVGPSGAGKTTLLRLLVGLAAPSAGQAATLDGAPRQDLWRGGTRTRRGNPAGLSPSRPTGKAEPAAYLTARIGL
ncbi:MAG: ATP-binding cassette domain-containing protein [Acidimicrobiales bacterium]|jgi:ABC-type multidrug transport system ATPase subunit